MASSRESRREDRLSGRKRAEEHKSGFDRTAIQVPDGVQFFSLDREGTRRIDIIPFIAGAGNPYADKGKMHFERTYFLHRDIGSGQQAYVCPRKTFGKRCPICEARAEMSKDPDADEDVIKALAPKERQLWNVLDHDELSKGVQLWDITYHWFGKLLDARIKNQEADDEYEYFADPRSGFTLRLTVSESDFARNKFEVSAIDFKPRKQPLDSDILEAAMSLDSLLIDTPYDKLKSIFLQTDDVESDEDEEDEEPVAKRSTSKPKSKRPVEDEDEEDDEPAPKKTSAKKPAKPVDDDDDWEDDEEPAPKSKSKESTTKTAGSKTKAPVEDDEDDEPAPKKTKAKVPVEDDDDWEDDEQPVSKKKSTVKKPAPPVEDDDDDEAPLPKKPKAKAPVDDDDDWDDDEPAPKKASAKKPAKAKPAEDEWEDVEDDEPAPKKKTKAKAPVDDDDWDDDTGPPF